MFKFSKLLFPLTLIFLNSAFVKAELSEEEAREKAEECLQNGCARTSEFKFRTSEFKFRTTELRAKTSVLKLNRAEVRVNSSNLNNKLSDLGAKISDSEIRIILKSGVLFGFDKSELRPDAVVVLKKVLAILQSEDLAKEKIRIEGHTDWIGSDAYNLKLSKRRAASVISWFVSEGVKKKRFSSAGYGESSPIDTNETDEGRQNNRRVEIKISRTGKR